ncbi:MAG: nicotinate phosphoribosyltransferase [Cyclobacteriaceae bacterium]
MVFPIKTALYTDQYELTMAQGYFYHGQKNVSANFDYFFRKKPFNGGFVVFAGLSDLILAIENFRFDDDDLTFLQEIGFKREFLEYLKDFKFSGSIFSMQEGEIVFPNQPILRIESSIIEAQVLETLVLNILNFESLIATKAARIKNIAGDRTVIDFGLRRAQGLAGLHASKAAIIGGAQSTSNLYSAKQFGLQAAGTMAHSWVQSFSSEYEAFSKFAETFPDHCILLVDTYHTLNSGIPNAIKVAKEMENRDQKLFGVRLDSGDLSYLSKQARKMLDEAGLNYVKIAASNQLDEYVIESLLNEGAPLDAFGVGTKLVTGGEDPALDGVYKLTLSNEKPRMKFSENIEKVILPHRKKTIRFSDENGYFRADGILLDKEQYTNMIFHPHQPDKSTEVTSYQTECLLKQVMEAGQALEIERNVQSISSYVSSRLSQLPSEHKRLKNPHEYKVGISKDLMDLRDQLKNELKEKFN